MLAQCPHCSTLFRISAGQLRAAQGQVRCGVCFDTFNAIDHLHDEGNLRARPEFPPPRGLPAPTSQEANAAPERMAPGVPVQVEADVGKTLVPVTLPVEREEFSPGFPDEATPVTRWNTLVWGIGGIVLLGGLLAQAIWHHGDALSNQYPAVRPVLEAACEHWGCEWIDRRDLQQVRLLSRDVRQHPRFQKTLLVNATLINDASFNQPYPVLQLGLYDTSGTMLAAGRFEPREYLDNSISMEAGMKPGLPVHIVLEVTEPDRGVVSYEFGFL